MYRTSLTRVGGAAFLCLGFLGCLRVSRSGASVVLPVPASAAGQSRIITDSTPQRAGQLTVAQLDSIAVLVHALRVTPDELVHTAGDSIRVRDLVLVFALDSAGAVLGELPFFDYGFSGRGARLLADGRLVLGRAGTVNFSIRFPQAHWRSRTSTRPSTAVRITVFRNAP